VSPTEGHLDEGGREKVSFEKNLREQASCLKPFSRYQKWMLEPSFFKKKVAKKCGGG